MAEDRLDELDARLRRLEDRLPASSGDASAGPSAAESAETFWMLTELRRAADPTIGYAGIVDRGPAGQVEWQFSHRSAEILEADWAAISAALGALAHPVRLRILQLVARGEAATAAELTRVDDLGTSGQVYHHLRQLVAAGWLRATVRGRHEVPAERLVPLLVILAAAR